MGIFRSGPRVVDPYNTMGTSPKKAAPTTGRPRTAEDNARYDEISRRVRRAARSGIGERQAREAVAAEFTSTVDYLKWCDRVDSAPDHHSEVSYYTGHVFGVSLFDDVKKLRGK